MSILHICHSSTWVPFLFPNAPFSLIFRIMCLPKELFKSPILQEAFPCYLRIHWYVYFLLSFASYSALQILSFHPMLSGLALHAHGVASETIAEALLLSTRSDHSICVNSVFSGWFSWKSYTAGECSLLKRPS